MDMHFSTAVSTREITMNFMETLIARAENNDVIPMLAESWSESPDHLTFTFKLRPGITFHNGQKLTSDDVVASYQRYIRLGLGVGTITNVASLSAPDPLTFVVQLARPVPSYIEDLSSFLIPLVIYPASERDKPGNKAAPIGTGPFRLVEWIPDSHVTLARFPGYQPRTDFDDATGFGGSKAACVERVIARSVKEPAARVAGLETAAFDGVESLPTKDAQRLKNNPKLKVIEQKNFTMPVMAPNLKKSPTDRLEIRQAIQAALDLDAILDAATDGAYSLQPSFQYPGTPYHTDAGKAFYGQHNLDRARALLKQGNYQGEEVVLLTNTDYDWMYTEGLVMAEQLKAVGINAKLLVVDWPTSREIRTKHPEQWNIYFTGWTTGPSIGPRDAVADVLPPTNMQNLPAEDPVLMAAWNDLLNTLDIAGRREAFARVQNRLYEQVYIYKMGDISRFTATKANVRNFKPYRITRFYNVWLE
jgi:peptide/nickel transport system substrate-binding protein